MAEEVLCGVRTAFARLPSASDGKEGHEKADCIIVTRLSFLAYGDNEKEKCRYLFAAADFREGDNFSHGRLGWQLARPAKRRSRTVVGDVVTSMRPRIMLRSLFVFFCWHHMSSLCS